MLGGPLRDSEGTRESVQADAVHLLVFVVLALWRHRTVVCLVRDLDLRRAQTFLQLEAESGVLYVYSYVQKGGTEKMKVVIE